MSPFAWRASDLKILCAVIMTKSGSKILDDFAQLAGGVVGLASHVQQQIKNDIKERIGEVISNLDLVPRDDLLKVEKMAEQSLIKNQELEKRIAALEAASDKKKTTTKKTSASKEKTAGKTGHGPKTKAAK